MGRQKSPDVENDGAIDHRTMTETKKKSVLFVCMGNICRSPTGECVFRRYVEDQGMGEHIRIDSAGTIAYHVGEPPDARMREAGRHRGIEIEGTARQFEFDDFERFDLIIAMDRENLRDILQQDAEGEYRGKVRLLCDFVPDAQTRDVPDPYYGGQKGFEQVLDLIESACPGVLSALQNGQTKPR